MSYHVVPIGKGQWRVVLSGHGQIGPVFRTQREASVYARSLSRSAKSELFIHRPDGRFRKRDSHGNDPFPPKG